MLPTARVLLPGRLRDGRVLTWTQIAQRTGYSQVIDGYTDWSVLVELRGDVDTETLPRAAAGRLDEVTARRLQSVLLDAAPTEWFWSREQTQSAQPDGASAPEALTASELVARCMSEGFAGKAWAGDITIEAPSYADSMLVTAPEAVLEKIADSGLEVHRISRAQHISIWRD